MKRKTIELPARYLKAASLYIGKEGIRKYLNGIFISHKGYIAATDGHQLFYIECKEAKSRREDMIIRITGTIPTNAETAVLTFADSDTGVISFRDVIDKDIKAKFTSLKELRPFCLIDGKFPDIDKVLSKNDPQSITKIGVQPKFFDNAHAACKALGTNFPTVEITFTGDQSQLNLRLKHPDEADSECRVVIMPCR